ncbi:hypothetical protein [Burkholderia sp. Ax-1719]|uniref:hypothetical protein n=1 Tax=Burkholderia sp. Ax-1719 TaxID=2608334 RepID=UPI00142117E1|nr:hypothetical protein [Burkholderia sp. Ax-1719]NIE67448.1 hypothetical protein [Burkholderia sp. Ax-1719]
MSKRAPCRNEVKTRLADEEYDAMQTFKALHGIESDSAAMQRIARLFLLGVVGTLPGQLAGVSVGSAQMGTAY